MYNQAHINGLLQAAVTLTQALELLQSCTKPSIYHSLSATHVLAERYYPWYDVLSHHQQKDLHTTPQGSILVDSKNDTCVFVHGPGLGTLQAIFKFPQYNATGKLSVDVLIHDAGECSKPGWTWFVGPHCSSNMFRECHNADIVTNGGFSRCRVTCVCPSLESCEVLHLKYTFDLSDIYTTGALCEVNLAHGDVNLPFYGID